LFAAYPLLDVEVAEWFFDHEAGKFPLSIDYDLNLVRRVANWIPFLLLLPPIFAVLRKLVFPNAPMAMAPSVVLFLIGSFLIGPGLTSNLLLKENWGRPRPNSVQQFAGTAPFEPWWRPSDACKRNCSFVSGEASQAFWTVRRQVSPRLRCGPWPSVAPSCSEQRSGPYAWCSAVTSSPTSCLPG
jgi:hypothetical protein